MSSPGFGLHAGFQSVSTIMSGGQRAASLVYADDVALFCTGFDHALEKFAAQWVVTGMTTGKP